MKIKTPEEQELYKKYQRYIKSKEFDKLRQLVFERDNNRCVCCGWDPSQKGKRSLQCHHNTYEYLFHENENLSCLVTMCNVCHVAIHRAISNLSRFKMKVKEDDK